MKLWIAAALFVAASTSQAGHLDVIGFTMKEGCSMTQYLAIVADFNEWAQAHGYQAEIAVPTFQSNLDTIYWLGRSADGETFGKAYDAWLSGIGESGSVPANLAERFGECADNDSRNAYRTFP
jgi:hypothetical protein